MIRLKHNSEFNLFQALRQSGAEGGRMFALLSKGILHPDMASVGER
jgi:hypothetical protein